MAEVKWIKIVTDIFDDEKILLIETLPEADSIIVIWFKLLCLAGKTNNSGVFVMNGIPYTDAMLSTIFRRKDSTVKLALSTFEKFGMIEIINNTITIPKWGKHQSIDQLENKKEYMRTYMAEYRAKQAQIAAPCKANGKTNGKTNVSSLDKIREDKIREDKTGITPNGFDEFWKAYPRHTAKEKAVKAWGKVDSSLLPEILEAIEKQKQSSQWQRDKGQYIPHPATWINQKRWEDEETEEPIAPKKQIKGHFEIIKDDWGREQEVFVDDSI